MSDTLRGMRGIMLDMYQRPDKLLAAEEKVSRFQLKFALDFSRATGVKSCFIPLHRGSDGFMSLAQFEKFYWPQLKNMMLVLIENGITPYVFYEGIWDQAAQLSGRASSRQDRRLVPGQRHLQGEGDRRQHHVHHRRHAQRAAGIGDCRGGAGADPKSVHIVGKGGGFIMSTGVGEMSGSKPELVKAWVDATRQYGTY